jgi:nitrogen regulatory protein P-II 1
MKKLEAIISPSHVDAVREALIQQRGLDGLTMSEVWAVGPHLRQTAVYRGAEYQVDAAPRVKVEVVVPDELAMPSAHVIVSAARGGCPVDARVTVVPVTEAVRIRTGEHGVAAIADALAQTAADRRRVA